MTQKEILIPFYLKNGKAVCGLKDDTLFMNGDAIELAQRCSNAGADAVLFFDLSDTDAEHDESIRVLRMITQAVDVPVYGGGNIRRVEDVKKLLYAGCRKVFLNYSKSANIEMTKEVSDRFGKEKILACIKESPEAEQAVSFQNLLDGLVVLEPCAVNTAVSMEGYYVLADDSAEALYDLLQKDDQISARGAACAAYLKEDTMIMDRKHFLKEKNILVSTYESSVAWEELKKDQTGLLPVVVQDYKTQEVLMVAYMNQEAFETTIRTGRMTYWSRSRQELWVKGLTSGHFQYVKELRIDCDNDTLLAKVLQVGAACHTGNRSCFYRTLMKKDYNETNPMKVFEDVYAVIEERRLHPKEGSYTNYLFEKGIDKILKKVGEEATEIIIAAKNPDPEEIKYEISDFLYHVMVLMAERGVTWDDITRELAQR